MLSVVGKRKCRAESGFELIAVREAASELVIWNFDGAAAREEV